MEGEISVQMKAHYSKAHELLKKFKLFQKPMLNSKITFLKRA
jgi:hypothetical protein